MKLLGRPVWNWYLLATIGWIAGTLIGFAKGEGVAAEGVVFSAVFAAMTFWAHHRPPST